MDKLVKKKFILLVQCRIGSLRLPAKVLFNFHGKSVFERIIEISKKIVSNHEDIVFLLGEEHQCYFLGKLCKKYGVKFEYCDPGYESNLYARYKNIVSKLSTDYKYFIRFTADNYLVQPKVVKKMIDDFNLNDWDYAYIKPLSHYACELVKIDTFLNNISYERDNLEHITPNIRKHFKKFNLKAYPKNFMKLDHSKSISLDTIDDLLILKKIESKKYCKKLDCIEEINQMKKILKKNKNNI